MRAVADRTACGWNHKRRRRGTRVRAADARAVPLSCVFGGMRVYGAYRIYYGPDFPEIRIVGKVIYSDADRNRMWCPGSDGFENDRK